MKKIEIKTESTPGTAIKSSDYIDGMPVFFPAGIFFIQEECSVLAPVTILANDMIHICPICGVFRVVRDTQIVYEKEHDHTAFIDPADWKLVSGDNNT